MSRNPTYVPCICIRCAVKSTLNPNTESPAPAEDWGGAASFLHSYPTESMIDADQKVNLNAPNLTYRTEDGSWDRSVIMKRGHTIAQSLDVKRPYAERLSEGMTRAWDEAKQARREDEEAKIQAQREGWKERLKAFNGEMTKQHDQNDYQSDDHFEEDYEEVHWGDDYQVRVEYSTLGREGYGISVLPIPQGEDRPDINQEYRVTAATSEKRDRMVQRIIQLLEADYSIKDAVDAATALTRAQRYDTRHIARASHMDVRDAYRRRKTALVCN